MTHDHQRASTRLAAARTPSQDPFRPRRTEQPITIRAARRLALRAEIEAILEAAYPTRIPTMADFDAREYDERGNPR